MRIWLLGLLCVVVCSLIIAFGIGERDASRLDREDKSLGDVGTAVGHELHSSPGEGVGERVVAGLSSVVTSNDEGYTSGIVADEVFGQPLVAVLTLQDGAGTWRTSVEGTFRIPLKPGRSVQATVSSPGYQSASLSLHAEGSTARQVIGLRAEGIGHLTVVDSESTPIQGATVTWSSASGSRPMEGGWNDPRRLATGALIERQTNADGRVQIRVAEAAIASVTDPKSGLKTGVLIRPGESALVTLAGCYQTIKFVDAMSGEPLTLLELESWVPSVPGRLIEYIRTDETGAVLIGASESDVLVRLVGNSRLQVELEVLSGRASVQSGPFEADGLLRILRADQQGEVTIAVAPCAGSIHLLDGETGTAIDGYATISYSRLPSASSAGAGGRFVRSPRSDAGSHPTPSYPVLAGVLQVPCFLRRARSSPSGSDGSERLTVVVSGYEPLQIQDFEDLVAPGDGYSIFNLARARPRTLEIVYEDGAPYTSSVQVLSPEKRLVCFSSPGRPSGKYGPFDWAGGVVTVKLEGGQTTINPTELSSQESLQIMVPGETGSITVTGVVDMSQAASLIAKLGLSFGSGTYSPTELGDNWCTFGGLPAGDYSVGPRKWVMGTLLQGVSVTIGEKPSSHRPRTHLGSGGNVSIPWLARWDLDGTREGSIRVRDGHDLLPILLPVYGVRDPQSASEGVLPKIILGRNWGALGLDAQGRYTIPACEPIPDLLAICLPSGLGRDWGGHGEMHLLETIVPGESIVIETCTFILKLQGDRPLDPIAVSYELPPEALRYPVFSYIRKAKFSWSGDEDLTIVGVPGHVRAISLGLRQLLLPPESGRQKSQTLLVTLSELPLLRGDDR